MIKFVCGGCGERLSVPDQHGGRKGVCPTCQTVNRIPLKGFSETQTRGFTPVVGPAKALPAIAPAAAPQSIAVAVEAPEPAATASQVTAPQAQPAREPDVFESIRKYREQAERASAAAQSDETVVLHKEKRLPRPLKIAILILAAIVLVGALYSALLFAVHAFLRAMQQ